MTPEGDRGERLVIPRDPTFLTTQQLDKAIDALRELLEQRLDYERTIVAEQLKARDKAIELQAAEYERRLTQLNHAHENAVKEQQRTTPREIHDQHIKDYDEFKLTTKMALTAIATRSMVMTTVVGIAVTLISLAMQYFRQ